MACKRTLQTHGFSLIELLVTIAISTLIVLVVILRFSAYDNIVILKNETFNLALNIREAQLIAVGQSVATGVPGVEDEPVVHGFYVNFDPDNNPATPARDYHIFKDTSTGGYRVDKFDAGDLVIETETLEDRYEIRDICLNGTTACASAGQVGQVSIGFVRPSYDPLFFYRDDVTNDNLNWNLIGGSGAPISDVTITVGVINDPTSEFSVTVGSTGDISTYRR